MKSLARLVAVLNKNPVFKFLSSVRLAVPLMLIIATVVAVGTIYESYYNTDVARLMVYRTWWFEVIMVLLWVNIFSAALSRFPFKKHHTGFVIVHIGLLTLLIGGQMTASFGVDGQLRIVEGQSSRTVTLDRLVVKAAPHDDASSLVTLPVERVLKPLAGDRLGLGELRERMGLIPVSYLPFVTEEQGYVPAEGGETGPSGIAVSFTMKSAFFNFSESMHTIDRPEMQMGPAHFRVVDDADAKTARGTTLSHGAVADHKIREPMLVVHDVAGGGVVAEVPVAQLVNTPVKVRGVTLTLTRSYKHAAVSNNMLVDKGGATVNPALDLRVSQGGKSLREIVFALFPTFSLNPQGAFGLKFSLEFPGLRPEVEGAEAAQAGHGGAMARGPNGNTVEFHVKRSETNRLRIVLRKAGAKVAEKELALGETFVTPWMGIQLTVSQLVVGGVQATRVKPVELQPKQPLPPSALELRADASGRTFWLVEGEARAVVTSRGTFDVYYGRDSINLPFSVTLQQFRKTDYPGTDTPMSFESTILPDGRTESPVVIQMNEPFLYKGHLLYQSSYEMGPDMPTASIFSVNHDPGRFTKYLGAVILILGIIIFTVMRSKWYTRFNQSARYARLARAFRRPLSRLLGAAAVGAVLAAGSGVARADSSNYNSFSPESARTEFMAFASRIDVSELARLPVQSRGRVKPLDSLARETLVFIAGKSSVFGLDPVQIFVGLAASPAGPYLELINIRDPDLRVKLGFAKERRAFTFTELRASGLEELARPLLAKQEEGEKSLSQSDKKLVEAFQQTWTLGALLSGGLFRQVVVLDVSHAGGGGASTLVEDKAARVLSALEGGDVAAAGRLSADLASVSRAQPMPELFRDSIGKMGIEVLYNHLRLFFTVAILYMLLGVTLVSGLVKKLSRKVVLGLLALPVGLHVTGFALRVYITGFAPVTNMYGTMVWMALGVVVFGTLLFVLYRDKAIFGLLLVGSSVTLLLTENLPLILSPDMDPIVAVLRNNFWLTIHVLTISISYAAFTIAMLIGNASLVRAVLNRQSLEQNKHQAHIAYRAMQLGVFLLTTGIILGGWWADYSWGRFWGWDPKETWALIADLGYLAILHARYVGWLGPAGVLAAAPLSYLLVIMAWYGVNFVLAAGLHSYGFSSGGAAFVAIFVGLQLALFAAAAAMRASHTRRRRHA